MVKTIEGFSRNIDASFKFAREDLNTLKMKSSFLQEKINELKRLDRNVKADMSELRKLVRDFKVKKVTPAKKKSVISTLKKEFGTSKTTTVVKQKPKSKPKAKKASLKLPKLQFYDVKERKRFEATEYREVVKNGTLFAVAKSPFGTHECYRILKKV